MKEIYLSYESGHIFKAYAIRYFRFRNNKYLIYTLNEIDQRNYIKLYVVKVMKELDTLVTQTVRSSNEWNLMKGLVKQILKELRNGKLSIIEDLNIEEIDKIVIYENKDFRLAKDLVNLLTQEKKSEILSDNNIEDIKMDEIESDKEIEVLSIEESDEPEVEEILDLVDDIKEEIEELEIFEESDEVESLELSEEIEELEI